MTRYIIRSSSRPMEGRSPIQPMDPREQKALDELRRRREAKEKAA